MTIGRCQPIVAGVVRRFDSERVTGRRQARCACTMSLISRKDGSMIGRARNRYERTAARPATSRIKPIDAAAKNSTATVDGQSQAGLLAAPGRRLNSAIKV